ncbi:hypothetical protein BLA24_19385 [Streptomyces cinnamoneus]|uniref:Uncharacterized protein n=1 Tax=Streptomyces cinnamoneus TaxID=53446 RepID=A0A2G1XF04_STRCJ|nr:hypothetical protein BLA24_19385 [Streptomyces cinnamoneus]PPT13410.1 hypothetical protein CYQ11_11415 [Streptomyces cinnamoneus]
MTAGALWLGGGGPAAAADGGRGDVHVLLNSAYDNRPGELIDIEVRGVRSTGDVTVSSPVFGHRVRLAPDRHGEGGHHARPVIDEGVRPGTYPLAVHAGGRVVAEDHVEVKASHKPEFQVGAVEDVLRPGERLTLWFDDLYPGEKGDSFTATSPAFRAPVRLAHDPKGGYWNNPRMFTAALALPQDLKDGTYKVALAGPDGRRIDEKPLRVRAARPGDSDYTGRVRGPAFFAPSGSPDTARAHSHKAGPGDTVNVLWRDASPDPGEEDRLTATSPAFERPVPLKRDDSKAGDGDDPRYYGPARLRDGLGAGRYPVTVISHHGRVKRTGHLLVKAEEAAAVGLDEPDRTLLIAGASMGAAALAVMGGVLLLRRRDRLRVTA